MDQEIHKLGMKLKFAYSLVGLLLGLTCIFVGMILGLSGIAGHTSLAMSVIGLSTNVNDAAPGVIVFIVGVAMVWITRFKIRHSSRKSHQPIQNEANKSYYMADFEEEMMYYKE